MRLPSVIGHRGAARTAPENTLAGLRRAKALGCDWVEFDVRLTGDGALVLCHDPLLDRTTSGSGLVSAKSLAAIRECDAGSWFDPSFTGERVPTLDEGLLLAAELDLGANVEIKSDRGREYATAALFRLIPRGWAELARRLGCTMIGADQRRLRPRRVAEIRDAGYKLAAFTVNDPARARLLFDWGVTSVFSDAPDIIRHVSAGYSPALVGQGAMR